MPTYATADDLSTYIADNPEVSAPGDDDAVDRLLERAERRVDGVLGPYALDATTGLKLDPVDLTAVQAAALARATCAAAEHELVVGAGVLVGGEDYLPDTVTLLRSASRQAPRVLEELAGTGLLTWSGTVQTEVA